MIVAIEIRIVSTVPLKIQENKFVVDLAKNQDVTEYWIGIHGHNLYSSNDTLITWNHYEPLSKPKPTMQNCQRIRFSGFL